MPRLPGNLVPGLPQHVIQCDNNRQAIFFTEADDRYYLDTLQQAAARYNCAIHAFVLMTNHVHLLVTPYAETGSPG
jgi:REP-associated tyrosine transposase